MLEEKKLSEESAREQVDLLLDYYGVVTEERFKDEELRKNFEATLDVMTSHVCRGRIVISLSDGDLKVVQHLKFMKDGDATTIDYGIISVKNKQQSDTAGEKKYTRLVALMGSVSGLGERAISELKGTDMSVMECIGAVFSNV